MIPKEPSTCEICGRMATRQLPIVEDVVDGQPRRAHLCGTHAAQVYRNRRAGLPSFHRQRQDRSHPEFVADVLARLREGHSQNQVARDLGVSPATVNKISKAL